MNRAEMIGRIRDRLEPWDLVVVGGGATGVGVALDAAARGYQTLLLEQHDFGKGTSSRSTKLVHGGVRYLRQGNVKLVYEALRERGLLRRNAPHLVHRLGFIVPGYGPWDRCFYGIGLKLYDWLAGRWSLGPSRLLSKDEALALAPTLEPHGLRGGVLFYDGQFDDARLLIDLVQTAATQGATLANYVRVVELKKGPDGKVRSVLARDEESSEILTADARVVVNASGVFADEVRRLDDPRRPLMIRPSQGIHFVLDRSFLPGESAILVPHTDDGRVLFAIPWHGSTILGTTDTPVPSASLEPKALAEEVEFVLAHAARYLTKKPAPADVRSVFAGLRPLVDARGAHRTSKLSRDHVVVVDPSGLLTITGGKWTTYRRMAQAAVDQAAALAGLERRPCATADLLIHGGWADGREPPAASAPTDPTLACYGAQAADVERLLAERIEWKEKLHPRLPYLRGQAVWAARKEMARTVEDVLARRTRALILDARAAREAAPLVAALLAAEFGKGKDWEQAQVDDFDRLARGYMLTCD